MFNQYFKFVRKWRICLARHQGVQCARDAKLAAKIDFNLSGGFHNCVKPLSSGCIVLGNSCWIEQGCVLWAFDGKIQVNQNVFIGPYVVIYGHGGVEIGENTLISMHCRILSSNHSLPVAGEVIRERPDVLLPTRIGSNCWIGAGATILGGVSIGNGCVIGAGAVVRGDLPDNSIAVGVPARIIKKLS